MLLATALRFFNHLLGQQPWARERLAPFAGQSVRLAFGALSLPLAIGSDGRLLADANAPRAATVSITLPSDAPWRALVDRASLFTSAHLSGSAELAETLGFVLRHLEWDAEGDLARVVGDIAAHRLVAGGRALTRWHRQQALNLALNFAEYLTEENPTIARRADVAGFCARSAALADDVAALEARIARLER